MVFMIKLPPALVMSSPVETDRKDDRMSLMKSLHRPYGQIDVTNGETRQHVDSTQQQYSLQHRCNDGISFENKDDKKHSCGPTRQKMALATFLMLCTCLVIFLVTATSYGKLPGTDIESLSISNAITDESNVPGDIAVKTGCGRIIGSAEDEAYAFKGIPYAKPPLGPLRWRKPVPLWIEESWCKQNSRHEATHFGSPCFQLNPYSKHFEGKEDCLYLNVWTPRLESSNAGLEVMVWIHGGFLQFGNGHDEGLSPSARLAKKLNVVFVSMNYRLYTFGFMALDMLADDVLTDSRGNYGVWDQLCVLQWVKDNIRSFGGDPKKVTLFGPDSGAASIMALMTSQKSQGLFRSVWIVGPTMIFNKTFEEVSVHNKALFLQRSSCQASQCLRKSTPERIFKAHLGKDDASFRIRDQNDLPIQGIFPEQLIVVDGELLKRPPLDSFRSKKLKTVPILLGSAAQAVDFWPGPDDLSSWTWNQYKKYVTTSLDSFGLQVSKMALAIYNGTAAQSMDPSHTAEYLYTTMVSDIRQTCPITEMAQHLAQFSRSPVYRYILKSTPSKPAKIYNYGAKYSFHLWDIIAFFDSIENFVENPETEDFAFRDNVQSTIMSFVKSGGHTVGDPRWLRFPKKSAELGQNTSFGDISKTECKFWSQSGLGIYAWVS